MLRRLEKMARGTLGRIPNRYVGNMLSWLGLLYGPVDRDVPLREAIYKAWRRPLSGRVGWLHVLGGVSLFLVIVLVTTGILLSFHYEPSHDAARESVLYIMTEVASGWLIRGIHNWAASLLVVLMLVHVVRTFFARAYRSPRMGNWYIGMLILPVVLFFQFTGVILPWDSNAYWSTVEANELAQTVPIWGSIVTHVAAGTDISNITLVRYFALHTIILPWALFFLLAFHLRFVRRHGIAPPQWRPGGKRQSDLDVVVVLRSDGGPEDTSRIEGLLAADEATCTLLEGTEKTLVQASHCTRETVDALALDPIVEEIVPLTHAARGRAFFPIHFFRVLSAILLTGGILVLLAAFFTPLVGEAADAFHRPESASVEWYFLWFENMRSLLPAALAFLPVLVLFLFPILALLWPLIDRHDAKGPRWPWLTPVLGVVCLGVFVFLTVWSSLS